MQNLLEKLTKKFKENKLKMASLAMASALTMSTVGLTSCKNTNENNSNSNINNSQEYPDNSSSSNNSENSSSTGGNENSSGGNSEIDYSQFSETFKNVWNNREYNNWIYYDENTVTTDKPCLSYQSPIYNSIPYGFLEDESFNINKIKQGKLYSKADLYIKDNEDALYIELRAEVEASTNYLANYILKYPLTKQEVKEIKILFSSLSSSQKTTYYQGPFFVQELSYLKEPQIISKAYSTLNALNTFENYANNKKFIASSTNATFMGSTFMDDSVNFDVYNTFQIHESVSNKYAFEPIGRMSIGQITTYAIGSNPFYIDGTIVYINTNLSAFDIFDEDKTKFENSKEVVTYLNSENCYFKSIFSGNSFTDEFSK